MVVDLDPHLGASSRRNPAKANPAGKGRAAKGMSGRRPAAASDPQLARTRKGGQAGRGRNAGE